jgi:hypothetical protein
MGEQVAHLTRQISRQVAVPGSMPLITLDIITLPMRLALGIGFWWAKPGKLTLWRLAMTPPDLLVAAPL